MRSIAEICGIRHFTPFIKRIWTFSKEFWAVFRIWILMDPPPRKDPVHFGLSDPDPDRLFHGTDLYQNESDQKHWFWAFIFFFWGGGLYKSLRILKVLLNRILGFQGKILASDKFFFFCRLSVRPKFVWTVLSEIFFLPIPNYPVPLLIDPDPHHWPPRKGVRYEFLTLPCL